MKKTVLALMIGFLLIGVNVFAAGDLIVDGSIEIPTTTATDGIIFQNGVRFIHGYGGFGDRSVVVGTEAGVLTGGSYGNTGIGWRTLGSLTDGGNNTAVGRMALQSCTNCSDNVAVGLSALDSLTTGRQNMAVGFAALGSLVSGTRNAAIGNSSLVNTTGSYNVGIAHDAGARNTTGEENVFIGFQAGKGPTTYAGSDKNTIIGTQAGYNIGAYMDANVYIGYEAGYSATGSDKLYIANGRYDSNVLIYGDFSTGNVGIGTLNPQSMLAVSGLPTSPPDTSSASYIVCIDPSGNMWVDNDGTNDCQ